jgi:hypothetical protein
MTKAPNPYDGEETASSTNVAWETGYLMHKLKLDPYLSPCTSINLKWIKDHNKTWNSESSARKIRNYNGTNSHRK